MKVFITGGAGFIGSHTVDALCDAGHEVTVYDLKPKHEASNLHGRIDNISYVQGDILDYDRLLEAMKGHTHVLHLAAVVSVQESVDDPVRSHAVNVTGTVQVFEIARHLQIERVVYASSAAVYGMQDIVPVTEDVPLNPQSPYGAQKAMDDMYARIYTELYGQSLMGLRYFNVFGPRQDPKSPYSGVISIFTDRIRNGSSITLYGDGNATRDFVSVHDIAHANVLALEHKGVGVCNIGSGREYTLNELISILELLKGASIEKRFEAPREGDIKRSAASIERANQLLGYTPRVTLEHGLKDLI